MPAPLKPYEDVVPSGQLIRDSIERMGISRREFADYVDYGYSTLRGWLSARPCSQAFIDACKKAADEVDDGALATEFADLARRLQENRDEESAKLDPWKGAQRKVCQPRPRRADVSTITGPWWAVWQTLRSHQEAVVLETVEITAAARTRKGLFDISNRADSSWLEPRWGADQAEPEHFRWEGGGGFFHHWVAGHFASAPDGPVVSGVFHLSLDNFREEMAGVWTGVSADSESTHALLVLGRTKTAAKLRFEAEREAQPGLPYLPGDATTENDVN